MKKILSLIICVAVILSAVAIMPAVASAEANLSLDVTYNPTSLSGAGNVTLSIKLTNGGTVEAKNVNLSFNGSNLSSISSLAAGANVSETHTVSIAENQLNTDLKVQASYDYDTTTAEGATETKSGTVSKTINIVKADAPPTSTPTATPTVPTGDVDVSVKVEADKFETTKNGKINLTFTVINTGDITIQDANIAASALNGGKNVNGTPFDLDPGQEKKVTYSATIMKDYTVSAVLTYTAAGTQYKENFTTVELKMISADMTINASADNRSIQSGETVSYNLTLTNTGETSMKNFKIVDSAGTSVPVSTSSLSAGKSTTVSYSKAYTQSENVSFTLTAEDEEGNSQSFTSNVIAVEVGNVVPTPSPTATVSPLPTETASGGSEFEQLLKVDVQIDKGNIEGPDTVTFNVVMQNLSDGEFRNIKVTEETLGTIQELNVIPAGETIEVPKQVEVTQSTSYVFSVYATDPTGAEHTYSSGTIPITVTPASSSGGATVDTLLIVVIVIIVLIVGTGVTLLIIMLKEKKKRKLEEEGMMATGAMRTDTGRRRNQRGDASPMGTQGQRREPAPQGARTRPEPVRRDAYGETGRMAATDDGYGAGESMQSHRRTQPIYEVEDVTAPVEVQTTEPVHQDTLVDEFTEVIAVSAVETQMPEKPKTNRVFEDRSNF